MHILLIEDDPLNIELFTAVLEDDGHQVTVERDGQTGKARALREAFELLILDIHLPRLRGDVVCRELRAAGRVIDSGRPPLAAGGSSYRKWKQRQLRDFPPARPRRSYRIALPN